MSFANDERVVSMKFDNARFEKGVSTTVKSLDSLKRGLNFDSSVKSLSSLERVGNRFSLDNIGKSVGTVASKFTNLGVVGTTALVNLTNSAVNAGKRILKALTIDPVRTGFNEYELKMNSVQTIMASTGKSIDEVNGYLNELNTYSDKTIYSFQDMTSNIGKFTNAGVSLDNAVMAIKGISNEAAVSGANANEAARAMYNFSQALSSGSIRLIDWKSIENANMATKEFKQQLIDTAVSLGTVKVQQDGVNKGLYTAANNGKVAFTATSKFNDSLQSQWMTSEVLIETLKKYADETTDIGKKAYAAAQDVKTFSQLYDTLKEAAQSGWAQSWEILVGDLEEAKHLLTNISKTVGGMLDRSAEKRNALLSGWDALGGRVIFIDALANAFEALRRVMAHVAGGFKDIFPDITVDRLLEVTKSFRRFTKSLILTGPQLINVRKTAKGFFAILDIGKMALGAVLKAMKPLLNIFGKIGSSVLSLTAKLGDNILKFRDYVKETDLFNGFFNKIGNVIGPAVDAISEKVDKLIAKIKNGDTIFGRLFKGAENRAGHFKDVADAVGEKTDSIFSKLGKHSGTLSKLSDRFTSMLDKMYDGLVKIIPKIGELGGNSGSSMQKLAKAFSSFIGNVGLESIIDVLNSGVVTSILLGIKSFVTNISKGTESFKNIGENVNKVLGSIQGMFSQLGAAIKAFTGEIKSETLMNIAKAIGILTVSIVALSLVDPVNLAASLAAVGGMMAEMFGALFVMSKLIGGITFKGIIKNIMSLGGLVGAMNGIAKSMILLSVAMVLLSALNWEELKVGLVGLGVILTEIGVFMALMGGTKSIRTKGLIKLALAIDILAIAVKSLGSFDKGALTQGLEAVASIMIMLAAFTFAVNGAKKITSISIGLTILGAAIFLFGGAIRYLGSTPIEVLVPGILALATVLGVLALAATNMPMNMPAIGFGILMMSVAVAALGASIKMLTAFNPDQLIGPVMALSILIGVLALSAKFLEDAQKGSFALDVAIGAIGMLAPSLKILASIPIAQIGTALLGLGGSIVILAAAGAILGHFTVALIGLIGLSAGIALIGVGLLGLGAGMLMFSAALAALSVSGVAGAAALTIVINTIGDAIPTISVKIGEGIVALAKTIAAGALAIGAAVTLVIVAIVTTLTSSSDVLIQGGLTLISNILTGIAANIGQITSAGLAIVANFMSAVASALPMVISSGISLMLSFINGMANGIRDNAATIYLAIGNLISSVLELMITGIQLLVEKIPGVGEKMSAGLEKAKDSIRETLTSEEMTKSGTEAMNKVADGANESADKLTDAGANGAEKFSTGFSNKLTGPGGIGDTLTESLNGTGLDPKGFGATLGSGVVSGMASVNEDAKSTGEDTVGSYISGAESSTSDVKSAGARLAGAGSVGANSKQQKFVDSGGYAASGFAKGMRDGVPSVSGAAAEMAQAALDKVNEILGVNSPARELIKTGHYTGEGFAIGMDDSSNLVKRSASRLGLTAMDGVRGTLKSFAAMVSDNIDAAPVIRPVMDLSNVRSGSRILSGMFGGKMLTANVTAANAYGISDPVRMRRQASFASGNGGAQKADSSTYIFNQYNNSPKALSRIDIYRDSTSLFSAFKGANDNK